MVNAGLLEPVLVDSDRPYPAPDPRHAVPDLSDQQREAAAKFVAAVEEHAFRPFLLDGVTGSGKTETYFEAIARAIGKRQQVLVLLPEIALTESFLKRFEARFGVAPVTWHSSLKSSSAAAPGAPSQGEARVVVGARSALFLPFARLGLIVVDEAHEISFKQDDGVRYNARDVAVMRARFEGVPVILASATPALESLQMAEAGRYERVVLPDRLAGRRCRTSRWSICANSNRRAATGLRLRWWKH
jgi:primosomal protein N' (replication factor Y)